MENCTAKIDKTIRVGIVATHPIQYHIPWFQRLAAQDNIRLKVYYTFLPNPTQQGVGFNEPLTWDIPLLEGYEWELLTNSVKTPGLDGFFSSRVSCIDKVFKKDSPDVVILTGWQSFSLLQGLWACKRLGTPCLVRGDSNALKPRPMALRLFHRILLSRYDGFLAVGCSNREFYLQNRVKRQHIFDCPHFVDNTRFLQQAEALREKRDAIRASWNIPRQAMCFVYAGKLVPKKRIFDLLHAVQQATETEPYIHLLVVGAGELMEAARSFVTERRLPVTFTGFLNQTEITRAYIASDCLVLPSDYGETWGLVVNESMACGLPAIVSDRVGCGPDLVQEKVTGGVFPFGDVQALAQKIVHMACDPQELRKIGQRARDRVLKDYSLERAVEGTMKAVEAVAYTR